MARDYKARPSETKKGASIWSGILIGVLVGLVLAVVVAVWLGRSNPFADRLQSADTKPAADVPAKPAKSPNQVIDPLAKSGGATTNDKPRFDFYNILQGNETAVTDQEAKQAQAAKAAEQYYLQAGAFPNAEDADNLKARLALMGYEAAIQTVEIPDKGVWHRVRLGPYKIDEANSTRDTLAQNKIQVSMIKIKNQSDGTQSKPN